MRNGISARAALFVTGLLAGSSAAQTAIGYQKPPEAIEKLLDALPTPVVRVSPDAATLLVEQPADFPTIADVAQPRYRLAGIRFNPATSGPSAGGYNVGLKLQAVPRAGGGTACQRSAREAEGKRCPLVAGLAPRDLPAAYGCNHAR